MAQLGIRKLRLSYGLLLSAVVYDVVSLLTSHRIVYSVQSRRAWHRRDDGLKSILKLLVVEASVGSH